MEMAKESQSNPRDRKLGLFLLLCFALSIVESFVLWTRLENSKRDYIELTREYRRLENKNYDDIKRDLRMLEEAREFLMECECIAPRKS